VKHNLFKVFITKKQRKNNLVITTLNKLHLTIFYLYICDLQTIFTTYNNGPLPTRFLKYCVKNGELSLLQANQYVNNRHEICNKHNNVVTRICDLPHTFASQKTVPPFLGAILIKNSHVYLLVGCFQASFK